MAVTQDGWKILDSDGWEVLFYRWILSHDSRMAVQVRVDVVAVVVVVVGKFLGLHKPKIHRGQGWVSPEAFQQSVDDLAKVACLSKYHALRSYQKIKRVTPYQKVLSLRLEESMRLISIWYSIAETAMLTQFSDRRALSRAFKKYFGYTPSKLQKNKQ